VYPDGQEDEYFYGLGNELLEDHENCPSCGTNTLDEYVWVGGRPVMLLRGTVNAQGNLNADLCGTCADLATCGVYFPVTDYLGKPVVLLDSSLLVAGAADYDPFGHVNRVVGLGDTPHPYVAAPSAQVVAGFRQIVPPGASYSVIARARFAMVDTDAVSSAYASLTDLKVSPLLQYPAGPGTVSNVGGPHYGGTTTGWAFVPNNTSSYPGQFQVRFSAATGSTRSGVAVAGYEYRKYQAGSVPTWLPLRLPGQYYDSETDFFQNWNRFYDANTGRYLEPEPLWLYPEKLVPIAAKGHSTPVYAYAGNNPVGNIDHNGNVVQFFAAGNNPVTSPDDLAVMNAVMEALQSIAAQTVSDENGERPTQEALEAQQLLNSPSFVVNVTVNAGPSPGAGVIGDSKPTSTGANVIIYNLDATRVYRGQIGGGNAPDIDYSAATIGAHEFGHASYYFWLSYHPEFRGNTFDSAARALDFANTYRASVGMRDMENYHDTLYFPPEIQRAR